MKSTLPATVAATCAALIAGAALVGAGGSPPSIATAQGAAGIAAAGNQPFASQRIAQLALRRANANHRALQALRRRISAGTPGPQGPAGPQGPPGTPERHLFAVLDPDGSTNELVVARSSGVVEATRTAVGEYQVRFDRDVSGCAAVATTWNGNHGLDTIRTAQVTERPDAPNRVTVLLRNRITGTTSDGGVSLAVLC